MAGETIDVLMPRLSDSMTDGTIARWLKEDGDQVKRGEEIVEIDSDKATLSFEADAAGTLHLHCAVGDVIAVGVPIASIETVAAGGGGGTPAPAPPLKARPESAKTATVAAAAATPKSEPVVAGIEGRRGGLNVSPVARRLAARLGVEVASVIGTGPYSRVLKRDVALAGGASAGHAVSPSNGRSAAPVLTTASRAPDGATRPFTHLERIVNERMAQAAAVPSFYLETEVAMTKVLQMREQLRVSLTPTPSVNDIIVKAVAMALRDHPRLNSSYSADGVVHHKQIDVAIAIAAGDDLFVPSVVAADTLSLAQVAVRSAELVAGARAHTLTPRDLSPGTFTVTNLGMFGTTRFTPLLNPPQAAILSVGAFRPGHARSEDGSAAPVAALGMVCDHRVVYGAHAAAFLESLVELLEAPMRLLL
jgi:pyruvate dehydrogenase E2 component (dihydrolipoamide acetyltransferase)